MTEIEKCGCISQFRNPIPTGAARWDVSLRIDEGFIRHFQFSLDLLPAPFAGDIPAGKSLRNGGLKH